ncbi:hypothetical protein E4T56_gene16248 [Termitomyces sp. T112]|nr:hypothetical protein E4T56_gene16248 [Termitomyces sp. T112]
MPGGQVMDQVAESSEPPVNEGEISMAIALSASVAEEEESQRQKLALQEEEDVVKALQASILETRDSGHPCVSGSSSSDQSTSRTHKASDDEVIARLLAPDKGYPTSANKESAPSQSAGDGSPNILSAKYKVHVEHQVPSPSPSTSSYFSCPLPVNEEEEGTGSRVESVFDVHLSYTDAKFPIMCHTQSPEPITNTLPNTVPLGSENHNEPPSSAKAYPSPVRNLSYLPEHSPRAETPRDLPSRPSSGKSSDPTSVGESSAASGSDGSLALSELPPPSYTETPYTETPLLVVEESTKQSTSHTTDSSSASTRNTTQYTPPLRPSSASLSPSIQYRLPSIASPVDLRDGSSTGQLSRNSSANSSSDHGRGSGDFYSARSSVSSTINVNAFVSKELFNGVSLGFMTPTISTRLIPMADEMPSNISLPYGKARPLHLQGPSWRHLLKLMASLSGTRMEAALDAIATMKTTPKLRTVIQFVKPHRNSPVWRTVFYFTLDYPSQLSSIRHRSVNDLPHSYNLTPLPTLLRDAADSQVSKTYTIPASDSVPFPTLPITFPNLALYMQAALEESRRYLHDSHSDYQKLAKMITTCYPDEDITPEPSERRGLFKRVMGFSSKPQKRGGNEDTYELVTPFVPDEWG